jgi:hypothetical protein
MYKTFDRYEPGEDGDQGSEEKAAMDAVEFARTRLRFEPDARRNLSGGKMSIAGYLRAGTTEVRMPKKGVDELGIRFEGVAANGERAVRETKPGDEHYDAVEDYDPVLRAHCRL